MGEPWQVEGPPVGFDPPVGALDAGDLALMVGDMMGRAQARAERVEREQAEQRAARADDRREMLAWRAARGLVPSLDRQMSAMGRQQDAEDELMAARSRVETLEARVQARASGGMLQALAANVALAAPAPDVPEPLPELSPQQLETRRHIRREVQRLRVGDRRPVESPHEIMRSARPPVRITDGSTNCGRSGCCV
jgi:hypothetical protein